MVFRIKNEFAREIVVELFPVQMIAIAKFGRSDFIPTTLQEVKKIVDASKTTQCSHIAHVNSCFEWSHIVIENALLNRNRQMCVEAWYKKCEGVDRSEIRTELCGSASCHPQCILTVSLVDLKDKVAHRNAYLKTSRRRNQQRRREARSNP